MKNLKNMVAATGLTAILMMSATSAQAGLLMSDRAGVADWEYTETTIVSQCTEDTGLVAKIRGIIVIAASGLLMSDAAPVETECQQDTFVTRTGLLMSD